MLQTMYDYAVSFYNSYGSPIEINAIAGSEHSANSWHYEGNTMDVSCVSPRNHCKDLENYCRYLYDLVSCLQQGVNSADKVPSCLTSQV